MEAFNQFFNLFQEVWFQGIFGINVSEIIIALIIFLFFYVLRRLFARFIIRRLSKFVLRSKNQIDDAIIDVIEGPLKFLPVVIGFFIAVAVTLPKTLSDKLTITFPPSIISDN